jgi:glycosyltransferase involved in cell wall biosynthesis
MTIPDESGLSQPVTWVLFFHDQAQANTIQKTWPANTELRFAPVRHYTLREQLVMPGIFRAAQLDLLHVPHFNIAWGYKGRTVITIHDLLWHEQRGSQVTTLKPWAYWLKYGLYLWTVNLAVKTAETIFVPAQTIKRTVANYYPNVSYKIVVTPEGLGEIYAQTARSIIKTGRWPKLKKPPNQPALNLVYTGSLYPHKNLQLILTALKNHPTWHLTLVGVRSVFQTEIKHQISDLKVQDQVTLAGYLTDKELITLYQQSHALVQPSLSEGFGLTGIEAMAAGTLVLASDIAIFREVYKSAAFFFNPKSVSHFEIVANHAAELTPKLRRRQLNQGLNLSQTYRWGDMVKQTLSYFLNPHHVRN